MPTDLSHFHAPVGTLFPPLTPAECAKHRLTDDQLAQFHRDGFLGGMQMLDDAQIEALRTELAELVHPDHDGREFWYEYHTNESTDPGAVLFHALGAWRLRPALHDILWNPATLARAAQLLGGPVRFWHDQLFCKPAKHGGVVAWHQDYSYWTRTTPMAHLTCWIGLDDSTVENGCVPIPFGAEIASVARERSRFCARGVGRPAGERRGADKASAEDRERRIRRSVNDAKESGEEIL